MSIFLRRRDGGPHAVLARALSRVRHCIAISFATGPARTANGTYLFTSVDVMFLIASRDQPVSPASPSFLRPSESRGTRRNRNKTCRTTDTPKKSANHREETPRPAHL